MPAIQRGQAYRLGPNKWGLRYYTAEGRRKRVSPFDSKSAALRHYRDVIEPELRGEPARMPELTLAELVDLYLERHAATVRPRTIATLRERLAHATRAFGDVPLRDLERMRGEIASWQAKLPERSRYGLVQAFRQTLRGWPTGMVILSMALGGGPTTFRAALDDDQDLPPPVVAFDSWWEDALLVSLDDIRWSRRRFILGAANQEGGGHVDPKPAAWWQDLRDGTWIGAVKIHGPAGEAPVSDLAPAAIRQITHELLATLEAAGHA